MTTAAEVIQWDVLNGDILGALIVCRECPCRDGYGCGGSGRLFQPYRLPGGAFIDLYSDADLLVHVLDRVAHQEPEGRDG